MTERIDLSALRVGDKVTLTFEVAKTEFGRVRLDHAHARFFLYPNFTYHGTVERAPGPLEAGDRVFWKLNGTSKPCTVLAIDGAQAWVRTEEIGNRGTAYLYELTREASHD